MDVGGNHIICIYIKYKYVLNSPSEGQKKDRVRPMVFILDGCSFYVAHVLCKKGLFPKKIGFDDSFDLTKCLQQIEMHYLLYVCA